VVAREGEAHCDAAGLPLTAHATRESPTSPRNTKTHRYSLTRAAHAGRPSLPSGESWTTSQAGPPDNHRVQDPPLAGRCHTGAHDPAQKVRPRSSESRRRQCGDAEGRATMTVIVMGWPEQVLRIGRTPCRLSRVGFRKQHDELSSAETDHDVSSMVTDRLRADRRSPSGREAS